MIYAIQQEIQEDAPSNAERVRKEGRTEDSARDRTEEGVEALMAYTLVNRIKRAGWPVFTDSGKVSKKWETSHKKANKEVLKRFGSKVAKQVNKIKVPRSELLGSHTKSGKIIISKRVPKKLRPAIELHEGIEHRLMKRKKSRK